VNESSHSFPKPRPSESAEASLRDEIERLTAMSMEERVREALSMEDEFQSLIIETMGTGTDER
jgi:hypothetical protein